MHTVPYIQPHIFDALPWLFVAVGQVGAIDKENPHGANMSFRYPLGLDDSARQAEDRRVAERYAFMQLRAQAVRLVRARLSHGTTVVDVDQTEAGMVDGDSLYTETPRTALAMCVGDCLAVVLADPSRRAVSLTHAGYRGLKDGALLAAVQTMTTRGSRPEDIVGYISPHAGPEFELYGEVLGEFRADLPQFLRGNRLDMSALALAQLAACGIAADQIEVSQEDTLTDKNYYSHRRPAASGEGRLGVVVSMI